jgi:hypothetical protein
MKMEGIKDSKLLDTERERRRDAPHAIRAFSYRSSVHLLNSLSHCSQEQGQSDNCFSVVCYSEVPLLRSIGAQAGQTCQLRAVIESPY